MSEWRLSRRLLEAGCLGQDHPGESISSPVQQRYPSTLPTISVWLPNGNGISRAQYNVFTMHLTTCSPPVRRRTVGCAALARYILQHTCKSSPHHSRLTPLYIFPLPIGTKPFIPGVPASCHSKPPHRHCFSPSRHIKLIP